MSVREMSANFNPRGSHFNKVDDIDNVILFKIISQCK